MSHIFVERHFNPPIDRACFDEMIRDSASCLPLYRVEWHQSLLACDGQKLLCHFQALDCDTVRTVTHDSEARHHTVWPGSHHNTGRPLQASTVVERSFDQEADLAAIQQQEEQHQWCLDTYQVTFIATFFSNDKRRMLCLYHAPDAESVRAAQRQAGLPFDTVWACHHLKPNTAPQQHNYCAPSRRTTI